MGSLRLVDLDGTQLLDMPGQAGDPLLVTTLDLGYPDVREDVEDAPESDGTIDETSFVGARGISAEFTARNPTTLELLAALAHPGRRMYLHVQSSGWDAERRILVRPAGLSAPFAAGTSVDGQMQWKAPVGLFEATTESAVEVPPIGIGETGLSEPIAEPVFTPPAYPPGETQVDVDGTVACWPVLDVYGPCSAPRLANVTTGKSISLPGLTIAAGRFVRIDMAARAITADGDPSVSRYGLLDFTTSRWWSLSPGRNALSLTATSPGSGCVARVTYRPRWI